MKIIKFLIPLTGFAAAVYLIAVILAKMFCITVQNVKNILRRIDVNWFWKGRKLCRWNNSVAYQGKKNEEILRVVGIIKAQICKFILKIFEL